MSFKVPEEFRMKLYSAENDGNNGAFLIPGRSLRDSLFVIASDGKGWEHVSISKKYECPTWEEMSRMKELFWDDPDDCVVQYHPPKSQYVNNHPYCLHLWRPIGKEMPLPDPILVGIKS